MMSTRGWTLSLAVLVSACATEEPAQRATAADSAAYPAAVPASADTLRVKADSMDAGGPEMPATQLGQDPAIPAAGRVYARFLPNGKLTARLVQSGNDEPPKIVLLEETPHALAAYEIAYSDTATVRVRLRYQLEPSRQFAGSPAP